MKKLDYNEEIKSSDDRYDDMDTNERDNNETFYVIKVLIPLDQYQTEYKAMYLSHGNTVVPTITNAKKYNSFNYAVDDSRSITDSYKQNRIWAPSYVMKKTKLSF